MSFYAVPSQLEDTTPLVGAPAAPPKSWFLEKPPDLGDVTYKAVEPSGKIFGRHYTKDAPLMTDDGSYQVAPPSPSGYRVFHDRASVITEEGDELGVGPVTFGGHYNGNPGDPKNVIALVRAHDDHLGGWYSGSLIPAATEADVVTVRHLQISPEWQPMPDSFSTRTGSSAARSAARCERWCSPQSVPPCCCPGSRRTGRRCIVRASTSSRNASTGSASSFVA